MIARLPSVSHDERDRTAVANAIFVPSCAQFPTEPATRSGVIATSGLCSCCFPKTAALHAPCPKSSFGRPWIPLKRLVSVVKVSINGLHSLLIGLIVAIMDYLPCHATEH